MKGILTFGGTSIPEVELNCFRKYLQNTTLTDLTTGDADKYVTQRTECMGHILEFHKAAQGDSQILETLPEGQEGLENTDEQ